jgi:uncharacterized membrane protein
MNSVQGKREPLESSNRADNVSNNSRVVIPLKTIPIILTVFFLATGLIMASVRFQFVQSNGLSEIQYPLQQYSFLMYWIALGLLLFAIIFNLTTSRKTILQLRRAILTSSFIASGISLASFSSFALWLLEVDYSGRCLGNCEPFVEKYLVLAMSLYGSIASGVVLTAIGLWLGVNRFHDYKRGNQSNMPQKKVSLQLTNL